MARRAANNNAGFKTVLSNGPFFLLWLAQFISQSGDAIFAIAFMWLVLTITNSVFLVGVAATIILLPKVLVGPLAGVYIDRLNQKNLMLASNLVQGIIVTIISLLYFFGILNLPGLFILVFLLGCVSQFFGPVVSVSIPKLVRKNELVAANSLYYLSSPINEIIGYGIGGIIIVLVGINVPIYYDAVTFFAALILILLIKSKPLNTKAVSSKAKALRTSIAAELREGITFIKRNRLIVEIIFLAMLCNFLVNCFGALNAPYAKFILHGNAQTYGYLLAASALGAALGALLTPRFNVKKHAGKILFVTAALTGIAIAATGVFPLFGLALLLFALIDLLTIVANVIITTLKQIVVPNKLRGRVFTAMTAMMAVTSPIGAFFSGTFASFAGIQNSLFVYGIILIIGVYVLYFSSRKLRYATY